jgi:hypothetical protein
MSEQQEIVISGRHLSFAKRRITIDNDFVRCHGGLEEEDDIYLLSDIHSVHIRTDPDMWRRSLAVLITVTPFVYLVFRNGFVDWKLFFVTPFGWLLFFSIWLVFLCKKFCVELGTSSGREPLISFISYHPFGVRRRTAYNQAKQLADVIISRIQ